MAGPSTLSQALIGTEGLIAPQKPLDLYRSMLIKNGLSTAPVGHWTEGAARLAQALLGSQELRGQYEDEEQRKAAPNELGRIVGGAAPQTAPQPTPQPVMAQPAPPMQRPLPTPSVVRPSAAPGVRDETMELPPSVIQRANAAPTAPTGFAPPEAARPNSFSERFNAAFPSQPPARLAQAQQPPAQPPQAPAAAPGQQSTMDQIDAMRRSSNPYVRAYGNQLMLEHGSKPPEFGVVGKDQYGNEQRGWIDPARRTATPATPSIPSFVDTKKLRDEVRDLPSYKNLAQAAPVYKSMFEAAGRDNRAADVNLIYGMAKIMDPGSVVRESEMTVAAAVATLPQQLQSQIMSQLNATGRLSPEVRAAIMQEARSRVEAYNGVFNTDMEMYRGIAQHGQFNPAHVIPSFGPFEQFKAPPTAAQAAEELRRRQGGGR